MLPVGPEVAWEVGHYPSLGVQDFWGPKSDAKRCKLFKEPGMIGTPFSSCNILNHASGEILSLNSNIIISPADCHGHPRPLLASVPLATGHLIECCLATLGQRISYAYYTDLSTKCYRTSRRARGFPTRYGIGYRYLGTSPSTK